ncbi:DUF3077 domain-containing protein [Pseudomonas mediterranea]|uniref:DUF3077 domain-containing protein n=1 Tax=Pseudomonas mediterranea TaxID=183795 RepID=UPI001315CE30|nr:DUF3077 domain-containing protein [Pseudomonas mediterranea]QHA84655.1 DUF3077 domain-containing protein [Pseudomonas mediterranea]UZE00380.1 DUF3077 domain-containing protein [Pseudomonas mediterranea]
MKNIVPDPPLTLPGQRRNHLHDSATQQILHRFSCRDADSALFDTLKKTTAIPVGSDSLFSVCAGIGAEEALVHVSLLLDCAVQVSDEITEQGSGVERGLIWSMIHSVEMARAVVDALLKGGKGAKTV